MATPYEEVTESFQDVVTSAQKVLTRHVLQLQGSELLKVSPEEVQKGIDALRESTERLISLCEKQVQDEV